MNTGLSTHGGEAGVRQTKNSAPHFPSRAFTLVEVLVTVALIAILSTLLVPSMRGLMGTAGPRGGVNVVASAIEQARLSALESGVSSYVGFPAELPGGENPFSAVIVFREARDDESGDFVAVTRWMRLPRSVHVDTSSLTESVSAGSALPKLGTEQVDELRALRFDRFGKLYDSAGAQTMRVGEKIEAEGDFTTGNYFELTVQPLTGRAVITERTAKGG